MGTLFTLLLANKMILPALGCLATAVVIYIKGRNSGLAEIQKQNQDAMDRIEADLQKREAANQNIETESQKNAETVRSTDGIPALIGLWNKLTNQKTPDSSSDKKAP